MNKKTKITKRLVGNLSIDMIIALVLFVGLFAAYLNVREDWIRDMANLVMGTIIGALRASMYHTTEQDEEHINQPIGNKISEETLTNKPDFIIEVEPEKE